MNKLFIYLIKFFIAFVITLVGLEIFLNFSEISLPSRVYDDSKFGRSHKPLSKIMEISVEGFYMGAINKYGYIGTAYPPERKIRSIRIALIGDSYVAGLQLFDKYHFARLLEEKLSSLLKKPVEVLNFGIGGIDFRGMYLLYSEKVLTFNPDIVLFFINEEDLLRESYLLKPELYLKNNSIKISYNFRNSPNYKLRKNFAFLRKSGIGSLIKEAYEFYKMGKAGEILLGKLYLSQSSDNKPIKVDYFQRPEDEKFFKLNKAIFEKLSKPQSPPKHANIVVSTENYPVYYQELIRRLDLTIFNLNQELLNQEKNGKNLNYWRASNKKGHWNHSGHQIVSNFLVKELYKYLKVIEL